MKQSSSDQYLYFDSQLKPKDKLALAKDELLMKEFEPDEKLMRSIEVALRKRPVDPERVERMVNGIVRQLESSGESEIDSGKIGEAMENSFVDWFQEQENNEKSAEKAPAARSTSSPRTP